MIVSKYMQTFISQRESNSYKVCAGCSPESVFARKCASSSIVADSSATPLEKEQILNELSWSVRLKVLDEINSTRPVPIAVAESSEHPVNKMQHNTTAIQQEATERRVAKESLVNRRQNDPAVLKEINAKLAQQDESKRRVGIESLVNRRQNYPVANKEIMAMLAQQDASKRRVGIEYLINRRQDDPLPPKEEISADENNMRLKLFRLMYETVRDSDLKVKRAELIQDRYTNQTAFQIGYLMGDVTDKFTIMTDISTTLTRFYGEWKPIEHINAYEQIANQAIEISHLIDLMRVANKRETPK